MRVAIVGGGVTGLSAADTLISAGDDVSCAIFERDDRVGGLAGSFRVNGVYLEKFYHHLFTSDRAIVELIERLELGHLMEWLPTSNGFYANRIYRLSTPLDLLRFSHLSLVERVRLGLLYLAARRVRRWQRLEEITAREWLIRIAGAGVYQKVWQPMLRTKFGPYADQVAAVWIWNKLKLRGSSRGRGQEERLGYLRGGFGQAIDAWEHHLTQNGVQIHTRAPVQEVVIESDRAAGLRVNGEFYPFDRVLVTTSPELLIQMAPDLPSDYAARLSLIKYLANVCLVLSLDRSLSDTYWLNIGDLSIPFTGVIEHTNMQRPDQYGGAHLAYLSCYLPADDPRYDLTAPELLAEYLPHLRKMFQGFSPIWVHDMWAWREPYAQPIIRQSYSQLKPPFQTPVRHLWLSCMAQVYPQDRGMNYAVLYGRQAALEMLEDVRHAGIG